MDKITPIHETLTKNLTPQGYKDFLQNLKERIRQAQLRSILSVNRELVLLYWQIGRDILLRQKTEGWGANVINKLSADIKTAFPDLKGFSPRNLGYMKKFAAAYPDSILQAPLAKLPEPHSTTLEQQPDFLPIPIAQFAQLSWYHQITLLDKVPNSDERLWYMTQTIENGWSRNVMVHMIETNLYQRQKTKKKTTNFDQTLPVQHKDIAKNLLKDPYIFDFITVSKKANEKNIEEQLCTHITRFLLELGQGFAFIGRQYHMEIAEEDFYIDLLFYNIKLRSYVVVELKARNFEPSDAGQLNFYISAVNAKLKTDADNETIGLLLCKGKNEILADYSLAGYNRPMGIADYHLTKAIPENLKPTLPSIEDIENELKNIEDATSDEKKNA